MVFNCSECKQCCWGFRLGGFEVNQKDLDKNQSLKDYVDDKSRVKVSNDEECRCSLLREKGCRYNYYSRPSFCRVYPIFVNDDNHLIIDMTCPQAQEVAIRWAKGDQEVIDLIDEVAKEYESNKELRLYIKEYVKELDYKCTLVLNKVIEVSNDGE